MVIAWTSLFHAIFFRKKRKPFCKAHGRFMRIENALQKDLAGDVKQLTNFTPEYRLRVGNYQVLFDVNGAKVIIYRVLHRKDAYK